MEHNFIRSDALMETEFLIEPEKLIHYHEDIELLYLMSGKINVNIEEREVNLQEGDIVLINANMRHACSTSEDSLIFRMLISSYRVTQLTGRNPVVFWMNPEERESRNYREAAGCVRKIIDAVVRKDHGEKGIRIYLNSLYYLLLHRLAENFMIDAAGNPETGEENAEERISSIFSYIRLNYRDSISLNDLADHLYLSPTYVSKYISRKCGMSFTELLNSVRLSHATEDLIYTDSYIMKIAMDNGFSSVAAFNKAFRDVHGTTPSEFREQLRKKEARTNGKTENNELLKSRLESYVETHPLTEWDEEVMSVIKEEADAAAAPLLFWNNSDSMITHVGAAANLLKTAFQEQLLFMKERIGIRYVCFWGIFAPDMLLSIHVQAGRGSYRALDAVTDFLVENGLKPYMELSFKNDRVLKNVREVIKDKESPDEFDSEEEMETFFRSLMKHFVGRYGENEVASWMFDYQEKEKLGFSDNQFFFEPMEAAGHADYFRRFSVIWKAFHSVTDHFRLGGGEFPLQHYGKEGFEKLLLLWSREEVRPAFITITCFPYEIQKDGKKYYEKRISDSGFVSRNVQIAKQCMTAAGFSDLKLHVTEFGMSLSNRNVVNDSCIKGAFMCRTVLEVLGEAAMLGPFMFTDVLADFLDAYGVLFGGNGLITVNGIAKPSLYAYEFLHSLYEEVIAHDENCMITRNGRGAYRIICHSFRELNYRYL